MNPKTPLLVAFFVLIAVSPIFAVPNNPNGPASRYGDDPVAISSVLRSATVYRNGAELVHTANAVLRPGNNDIAIDDISNTLDINSVRIGCDGNVTIMSVGFSKEYLKPETKSALTKKLEDSLDIIRKELGKTMVLIKTDNDLLELLGSNKQIGGAQSGVNIAELMKMMEYYKQKSLELQNELSGYKEKESRLNKLSERLESQIAEEEKKNAHVSGRLLVQLLSPEGGSVQFNVSYLTPMAYWNPSYDLKVANISSPLTLIYKAKLVQTSGIDWKQVKLTLSTSVPNQNGNAPVLKTWFLSLIDPLARAQDSFKENTIQSFGAAPSVSSQRLKDIVVVGYGFQKKDLSGYIDFNKKEEKPLGDYVSVRDNAMNVVFDIDIPYDIPGNGKEQSVELKNYSIPVNYKYYSAPRLDKESYLLGELSDWGKLNLLPGEANIIFEGTYIGKSFIDPNSTQDTLNLTLGRDRRVVVTREKLTDYSSVKFLGANRRQVFTYEITVKNNKKEKVQLLLKDQYPISTNKDVEIELLDSSGAAVNGETGVLTWKIELTPGESKKYRISYSVKYPKDREVNIN
jgi:uncharacterized protein (TIGR02231 family)